MTAPRAGKGAGVRVRLRVDLAPGCAIGPGKIALLERIGREGSLSEAARSLEMSYRRAWNLLDEINRSFAEPAATTAVGGKRGGGARLTHFGAMLVREYRELEGAVTRMAGRRLRDIEARDARGAAKVRRLSRTRVPRKAR